MDLDNKTTMDIDRLKFKPSKVCGICGDKALGYNFNAITCEACKAFFRRNALRSKDFKCPFDGNCKIDMVTRRFCQKCRLKKCFDIGMKKEWILSEEEKKVKREKIIENRKKKDTNHNLNDGCGGGGGGPGMHLYSQLSNISDNNTSSSSNSHPDLSKSNDCLTAATNTTIDDDDFMAIATAATTTGPTLTGVVVENVAASNSCYNNDHHQHQQQHHHNAHHHLHSHNNNENCNKEFMNSIHLLKQQHQHHQQQHQQQQHRNHTVDDLYLGNSKFFPIKESSSSSTTDDCSPSPPAIPLSLCQPKSNHPLTNNMKQTFLYNKIHNHHPQQHNSNNHNLNHDNNHDLHTNSNSTTTTNSSLITSLSQKTINNNNCDNDGDLNRSLPPTLPLSKAHLHNNHHNNHNHNHNNNYHYPQHHNWFENDVGGNSSDPNTTDNLNHYLESKPLNLNMIKQVANSRHHQQPIIDQSTNHKEASSSPSPSSSSSLSSSQYPIIPKHLFKTEPVQEEIVVSASRQHHNNHHHLNQHHSYHPNEFGSVTNHHIHSHLQHPLHSPTHHIISIQSGLGPGIRRMNSNSRNTTCDISSGISSDESETATVYIAYDGVDRRNYPDDLSPLQRSVSLANASANDQIKSIADHPSHEIGGLINVDDDTSFDKMNLVDNHHQTTFDGGGDGGGGDSLDLVGDNKQQQQQQQIPQLQSQFQSGNSISIIQQDLASVPNGPHSSGYNFVEIIRMEELTYACGHLQDWYHHGPLLDEILHLTEIYQVAEQVIHHLVSMAKMINSFCELCETDQISLLKYSVTELIILRSAPCFISNKDAWIFNLKRNEKGTILKFKTCQSQLPSTEFSDDIKHFMMAIPDTCRNDQSLFDLATMVVLFNPNRLELKHKEVVRLEYMTYCHLLRKYINTNYSSSSSSSSTSATKSNRIHLDTILNLIDRLHKINDKIKHRLPFRIIEEFKAKLIHFG